MNKSLAEDPEVLIAEMLAKVKLSRVASIREEECIGCTKCIQACPVDAIVGASKQMHTVLTDVCIGCELCIKPCPVDCIELQPTSRTATLPAQELRQRYLRKIARQPLEAESAEMILPSLADREDAIQAAVARVRAKRLKHDG